MVKKLKLKREDWIKILTRFLIIAIGNLLLAFGTSIFLVQCNIVAGGLSGLGILFQKFLPVDVTMAILQWAMFFLGWFLLGKKFALQTLVATIIYPLGVAFFTRIIGYNNIDLLRFSQISEGVFSESTLLIASMFGGAICGIGVAMNMIGGGSTGGLDILALLLHKVTKIKTSFWMFVIDAAIILAGAFFVNSDDAFFHLLVGVLCAFICAMVLELMFARQNNCYVAQIISKNWKEINKYIHDDLGRGSTILTVEGGYRYQEYRMIQVAFSQNERLLLLNAIATIDNKAFVTCFQAREINGEGFRSLPKVTLVNKTKKVKVKKHG